MAVTLSATQRKNYRTSRDVFDAWFDKNKPTTGSRYDWWLRLVAALQTESGCLIYAHDGVWGGGGKINDKQSAILRESLAFPHDAIGHNGGSVGPLQQIPTPVAQAADKPWGGWGTIQDCMRIETSIPKFLAQLRVTTDSTYGGKPMASPVVADLLRVQQPLASEVAANYGAAVVAAAKEIADQFEQAPVVPPKESNMALRDDYKADLKAALEAATATLPSKAGRAVWDQQIVEKGGAPVWQLLVWTLAAVDRLEVSLARFESRVFERDDAVNPWSITNEIQYGNDLLIAKVEALQKAVDALAAKVG